MVKFCLSSLWCAISENYYHAKAPFRFDQNLIIIDKWKNNKLWNTYLKLIIVIEFSRITYSNAFDNSHGVFFKENHNPKPEIEIL